jgi:hypothetical protein
MTENGFHRFTASSAEQPWLNHWTHILMKGESKLKKKIWLCFTFYWNICYKVKVNTCNDNDNYNVFYIVHIATFLLCCVDQFIQLLLVSITLLQYWLRIAHDLYFIISICGVISCFYAAVLCFLTFWFLVFKSYHATTFRFWTSVLVPSHFIIVLKTAIPNLLFSHVLLHSVYSLDYYWNLLQVWPTHFIIVVYI